MTEITGSTMSAFKTYDADQSGGISKQEVKTLLKSRGFQLTDDYIEKVWDSLDTDGSGTLELREFSALMKILTTKIDQAASASSKPATDTQPELPAADKSVLAVTIVSATGLRSHTSLARNDPYVLLEVNGATAKTDTAYAGGTDPVWGAGGRGEQLHFLAAAIPSSISFKVLDDDFNPSDLLTGHKNFASVKNMINDVITDVELGVGEMSLGAEWDGRRTKRMVSLQHGGECEPAGEWIWRAAAVAAVCCPLCLPAACHRRHTIASFDGCNSAAWFHFAGGADALIAGKASGGGSNPTAADEHHSGRLEVIIEWKTMEDCGDHGHMPEHKRRDPPPLENVVVTPRSKSPSRRAPPPAPPVSSA